MKVAEAMAKVIKGYGASHVFTLTGAPQDMLLALEQNEKVNIALGRSERSVMAMADGYARFSGKPTFSYNQFGPGATAVVGGISDALWGFSPVVSVSSAVATASRFRFAYQEVDQQALLAQVTKWTGYATEAARAPDMLNRAVIEAMSGPPGPVHLDVASNFFSMPYPGELTSMVSDRHMTVPAQRVAPPQDEIDRAAALLRKAKRPVILAGGGVIISKAWEELTRLAEALSIPVVTSMAGKGSIAETHPLAVGVCGVYSRIPANETLKAADVCFAVGTKLGQMPTDVYKLPAEATKLMHLDLDPRVLGRNFKCDVSIVADAKIGLSMLLDAVADSRKPPQKSEWALDAAKRTSAWRKRFEQLAGKKMVQGRINPRYVMHLLNQFVGPDDIVVADTGYSAAWAGTMIETKAAGQGYIRAAGSLGWAFPGAIGVRLAAPRSKRVICLTGDGGFGYHLSDLDTAVRMGAPVVTVVLNNATLGFEYTVQKLYYGKITRAAHAFGDNNFADIATAFGARGVRVNSPDQLLPALKRAAKSDKPTVIDVLSSAEIGAPYTRYENAEGERDL